MKHFKTSTYLQSLPFSAFPQSESVLHHNAVPYYPHKSPHYCLKKTQANPLWHSSARWCGVATARSCCLGLAGSCRRTLAASRSWGKLQPCAAAIHRVYFGTGREQYTEWQNCRTVWVARDLKDHLAFLLLKGTYKKYEERGGSGFKLRAGLN